MTGVDDFDLTVDRRKLHFPVREQFAVPYQPFDLVCLEQACNTTCKLPHNAGASLLHGCDVDADITGCDAVLLELMLSPMIKLRRFQ